MVVGGTGLYLRAALAELELPPAPPRAPASGGPALRRGGARGRARAARRASTRRPPPRSIRTTAAASSVRSSSRRPARRSRLRGTGSGRGRRGIRPSSSASTCRRSCSTTGSPRATSEMFAAGVEDEVARALARDLAAPRARRWGSTRSRTSRADEAIAALVSARAATPRTSANGCGASRASLWSMPTARRARSPMTSSPWHAHGNVYLVSDDADLTPERVRERGAGTDGIVQVVRARRRRGGDRDLEYGRLDRGDVRQRHAHRRCVVVARTGARRRTHRRRSARRSRCARSATPVRVRHGGGRGRRARDRRRARAHDGRRSAIRMRSSSATRTTSRGSVRCSRRTRAFRIARMSRSRASTARAR